MASRQGRVNTSHPISRGPGASTHTQSVVDKVRAYVAHHRKVGLETLAGLLRTWLTSLMTWLVIGIALALPTILYILLANIGSFGGDWQGKPRISLYLTDQVTEQAARTLMTTFEQDADISSVVYISAEGALAEFQASTGFGDVLDSLPKNPLPSLIEIEPAALSPAQVSLMVLRLETYSEIESISVDLEWIERLFAIISLGERFVSALGFFLGLGVLLAIGNTIRLAIENRRAEIEVIKLVGGTDRFVRRPFLYLGFWYGLGGAIVAWLMIQLSLLFLSGPIEQLIHSYQGDFRLVGLATGETLVLMLIGSCLGVLGSALAVGRHLHQIEPK